VGFAHQYGLQRHNALSKSFNANNLTFRTVEEGFEGIFVFVQKESLTSQVIVFLGFLASG